TGCALTELLEAAHIHPYKGAHTNVVSNGLLLRADIHTLFDLGLINIDPDSLNVCISEKLVGTDYEYLKKLRVKLPIKNIDSPNHDALKWHLIQQKNS
ncbi:HNH endonuclease, partial [Yersinia enterocolitica]